MAVSEEARGGALLLSLLCGAILMPPGWAGPLQPARRPVPPGLPFLVLWGIPDAACLRRPDPAAFGMEREGCVSLFYEDNLGLYPFYSSQNQPVSGGLPQHTSLDVHLQRTEADVLNALPSPEARGLGVICWEEWASQWERNRGKQKIYQQESRALLRGFFPEWSPEEVDKWAQVDFEAAAQSILMETLQEARRIRPQVLWGVAPYPSCYNSGPHRRLGNDTGRCPASEMALNDELLWLWKRSSALYPALLLDKLLARTQDAQLYASNQIREALRVAALPGAAYDLPVFPLVRSVYTSTNTFLSEADLVNTMGESAAMGAAGVIIWDKFFSAKTQRACWELAEFVQEVLGPYAVNVTTAARLCGEALCQGRGRCLRKNPEDRSYLHLPPASFLLLSEGADGLEVMGELAPEDLEGWRRNFQCQWYEALEGTAADEESPLARAKGQGLKPSTLTERTTLAGPTEPGPTEAGPTVAGSTAAGPTELGPTKLGPTTQLPAQPTSAPTAAPTTSGLNQGTAPLTPAFLTLLLPMLPFLTLT
ncbi:glyco_hydro_56 domain-containing protein [Conger conger]|uniref:glyco_hydro_56 domain-containing protein n=1 Tax=Conger conger TaxID=82655 RepID=UPI002A5ADA7E|nr:glyco_hydro_56 domain-containing protein [Conger conger]